MEQEKLNQFLDAIRNDKIETVKQWLDKNVSNIDDQINADDVCVYHSVRFVFLYLNNINYIPAHNELDVVSC